MKIFNNRNGIIIAGLFLMIGLILILFDYPVKTTPQPRIENMPPASEGSVINLSFYSKSLKKDQNIQVYLPEGYDQEKNIRYPVIYFLHCSSLARKISKEDKLVIYFDCGIQDETYAYPFNTKFAEALDQLELPYQFQSYQGGHYDRDSRYPVGLAFLDSVMNKTGW